MIALTLDSRIWCHALYFTIGEKFSYFCHENPERAKNPPYDDQKPSLLVYLGNMSQVSIRRRPEEVASREVSGDQ